MKSVDNQLIHGQEHPEGLRKDKSQASLDQNSSLNSSQVKEEQSEDEPEDVVKSQIEIDAENQRARKLILDAKFVRISQIIFRQKVKTVLVISVLGLVFSAYFVAGYFFSVKPF